MTSPFQNAVEAMFGAQEAFAGEQVTYERGLESVTLTATIGETLFDVADREGFLTRVESVDFLIAAADLQLGGAAVEPQKGDLIKRTVGSTVYVHEVRAPADNHPWRHSDRGKSRYRIHTTLVEEQ